MKIIFDYFNFDPKNELDSAWGRMPSDEFANFGSLKGRAVCVWKVIYHTVGIVGKPVCYIALGVTNIASHVIFSAIGARFNLDYTRTGKNLILTGLVAPLGQILQIFKATMGILHPGCYFKENECSVYFKQLTAIAEEVGCEAELIEAFRKGPTTIERCLQTSGAPVYYEALFKNDLAIICEKLNDPFLTQDEKLAVLNMFASLPSDPKESGIQACAPGLGRLLEQICACIDIPKETNQVLPWLVARIKEEILHNITIQEELTGKRLLAIDMNLPDNGDIQVKSITMDAAHFGNFLIMKFGKKIGLSQEIIDKASQDVVAKDFNLPEDEQQELLDRFNELYTQDFIETYLMERINSQPDGRPGLKNFRISMIERLAQQVSEKEIKSSKQEVQDKLGIDEALADDPIFYVKLHYFLYPDVDPSDEKASDLNIEGIKAFAATLENNPFDYFKAP